MQDDDADMTAETVPVPALLMAVHDELSSLHGSALDVQALVGELFGHAPALPELHAQAQAIDVLTQRLDALATFLQTLASIVPPGWEVDAAAAARDVLLGSVAARLAGRACDEGHDAGVLELF